jgi:hypothetical protein
MPVKRLEMPALQYLVDVCLNLAVQQRATGIESKLTSLKEES